MAIAENTSPPDTDAAAMLQESPFRRIVSDYMESPLAVIGLIGTAIIVFIAIFAPLISPQNPYDLGAIDILDSLLAPWRERPIPAAHTGSAPTIRAATW